MKNQAAFREQFYRTVKELLYIYFKEIFKGPRENSRRL